MKQLHPFFQKFEKDRPIMGLTNELQAIYASEFFIKEKKSIVFVTNTLYEANLFYQMILNYTDSVFFFPMDDFLTSEALAISPEFEMTRLETIRFILNETPSIVVTNLMGYLRFLPTKQNFMDSYLTLKKDDEFMMNQLLERLYKMGYHREVTVSKTGDMAVRGYVIDVFPIGEENPIRLEFWGDTIDSIRQFDLNSQLTVKSIDKITIMPSSEFITSKEIELENKHQKDLTKYESVENITQYTDAIVLFHNYDEIMVGYQNLQDEIMEYNKNNALPSETTYMFQLEHLHPMHIVPFYKFDNAFMEKQSPIIFSSHTLELFQSNLSLINSRLNEYLKEKNMVVICLSNRYKAQKLCDDLANPDILFTNEQELFEHKINIIVKKIEYGFEFDSWIVISEREIFHKKEQNNPYKTNFKYGTRIRDINKLNVGDYVVHNLHGIGQYCGIKTLTKNGLKKDYLLIAYKGQDKLYIPVEKIDFISKYSSNDGLIPKLNKLGGIEWQKTKMRVKAKIESIAGDLLKLYAKREASIGFSFLPDNDDQIMFEKEFPYQATIDQLRVIEEIKKDMESPHPMDRLLCGDVGYGKTEVAFRAIFKAILSGKQAALLCPTTILSNQHYTNALERFKSFAVNIELLNRFVSSKKLKQIIEQLEDGKIDLVIGTHRLLSEDIKFKDLGLLVIDEEQRFGVKHKEKIKQYKNNVDVLTLSATPIPRTLQMSIAGVRSLSLLETPPVNRYPVQTYVLAENHALIKEAIYKELSRDGQVFILYNHIDNMECKKNEIQLLVPDATIITAHGQMNKQQLEDVMQKFMDHEYDVLICTTIIETGIDIPSVNTLIIMDADRFGLSQLYQIRGRVGRSNRIAYCYLMYTPGKILSDVAVKRLNVIKDFTALGSGFSIAMRDLSIRGAGDILGSEQAGFIDSVGIELFLNMLKDEMNRLKGIASKEEEIDDMPFLDVTTNIADSYVEEEELKIEIHKKINSIDSYESLLKIKQEIEDRFGIISKEIEIYMYQEWFEKLAKRLGIIQVKQTKNFVELLISADVTEKINGEFLFIEVNRLSRMFRFGMNRKQLLVTLDTVKLDKHFVYYLISFLEILEKSLKEQS